MQSDGKTHKTHTVLSIGTEHVSFLFFLLAHIRTVGDNNGAFVVRSGTGKLLRDNEDLMLTS